MQMETFPVLLALCAGNSPVNSPHKGPWRGALRFSLIWTLNKWLSKQSWDWWFETPPRPLWRHCNVPRMCFHDVTQRRWTVFIILGMYCYNENHSTDWGHLARPKGRKLLIHTGFSNHGHVAYWRHASRDTAHPPANIALAVDRAFRR